MPYPTNPTEIKDFFTAITKIQALPQASEGQLQIQSVFGKYLEPDKLKTLYVLFSEKPETPEKIQYQQLLIYSTFRVLLEQNGSAEEHSSKLYTLFQGDINKITKYLCDYANQNKTAPEPMHAACGFAIPALEDFDESGKTVWCELSVKFLTEPSFRALLPQAVEITELIKDKQPAKKVDMKTKKDIATLISEIQTLNKKIKKAQAQHEGLTPEQETKLQDNVNEFMQKQEDLTQIGVPFNKELTLTALSAFREKCILEANSIYKNFLENGLAKKDYEKFMELKRQDDDERIPPLSINGATLGHPGYYLMKVPVLDESHAARAAYFGKLTNCCQSLSGEAGEPCVIHGLTSPHGGFYVVCQGNAQHPQVTDKLLGMSWVWRSKADALVFDSIETSQSTPAIDTHTKQIVTDLVREAAKQLTEEHHIDRVLCGASSGISTQVGITPEIFTPEQFIDYKGYCDSDSQLILNDKHRPFYWYDVNPKSTPAIKDWFMKILNTQSPLVNSTNFCEALHWALLTRKEPLIDLISTWATTSSFSATAEYFMAGLMQYIPDLKQIQMNTRASEVKLLITNLEEYIHNGLTPDVISAIEKKLFFLEARNHEGHTPLMQASLSGNTKIALTLIQQGANLEQIDKNRKTGLMLAIKANATDIAMALIQENVNLEQADIYRQTALMTAIQAKEINIAMALIQANANLQHVDIDGETALMKAIQTKQTGIAMALIQANANLEQADAYGQTALMKAIKAKKTDIAMALIKANANLEQADAYGKTALMTAIQAPEINIAMALIQANANLQQVDAYGKTALMYAATHNSTDIVRALIQAKVNLEQVNTYGSTALMHAAIHQATDTVRALIEAKVNLEHVGKNGNTALMYAAMSNATDIVRALIQANVNLEHVDKNGKTALMHAAMNNATDIVRALIEAKVNLDQVDVDGDTALRYATQHGNQEIISAIETRLQAIQAEKTTPAVIRFSQASPNLTDTKTEETKTEVPQESDPLSMRYKKPD